LSLSLISLSAFLELELLGAAALAAWVLVRKPNFGPRSVTRAILVSLLAVAAGDAAPYLAKLIAKAPHGPYIALFACVLPVFVFMLLAAAWLVRALLDLVGGGGGGGWPRVRRLARSRSRSRD